MHQAVRTLGDIASRNARHFPHREAVIDGEVRLTHAEVNLRANRLANALRGLGVQAGDRVALLARNDYRFVEIYFGLPRIGVIFSPLNFWASERELIYVLNRFGASVLIVSADYQETFAAIRPELKSLRHVIGYGGNLPADYLRYDDLIAQADEDEPSPRPEPDADTLILLTSGSTGMPKGAVYTHNALLYTDVAMNLEYGVREDDISLHFLPMFSSNLEHLGPLSYAGATHVILPRFDPSEVWRAIQRERVTHIDAVPTTIRLLLQAPDLDHYDSSSLRLVTYASEPMPPATLRQWLETFPHTQAVQFYGMIEFLCVTAQQPAAQLEKIGTVGKPHAGTDVRLIDEQGADVAPGAVGEVIARCPCGMRGYWDDPEATAQAMSDGWMRTGDLGQFSEDGFLTLVGRKKDIIKTGGMSVSAAEVEGVIYEHPAIAEAAVFGIPDEQYGEAVQAVVALKPGVSVSEEDVITFVGERLAGYKRPRRVAFMESLPKTGIGKISRKTLQDQFKEAAHARSQS
jgi:acyl-CoA synthetase (AMP-forming)/AMP-acid ligase II